MTTKLYAHNPYSEGCRELAAALGIRRIKHVGSTWRPRAGDTVINWGSSRTPDFGPATIINPSAAVTRASNKLSFFQAVNDTSITPEWTTDIEVARGWIQEGDRVVQRTLLTSHSGRGIIIADVETDLVRAPLYTRYIKKQAEYRVHIVRGNVVDVQRKIRDPNNTPTDWSVRSYANGFIFVRNDVELPAEAQTKAVSAFAATGLDFGAVDVVVKRSGAAFVLEVNTAPGLTGTTVTNYAEAFRREFL